ATMRPTSRLGTTITATMVVVSQSAWRNRSTATSGVIVQSPPWSRSRVYLSASRCSPTPGKPAVRSHARPLGHRKAGGQGTYDQGPAVDQYEQHDLERQRDDQRRQHHHTHGHEHAGHHQIDHQKGDEDHEADLEGGLEL